MSQKVVNRAKDKSMKPKDQLEIEKQALYGYSYTDKIISDDVFGTLIGTRYKVTDFIPYGSLEYSPYTKEVMDQNFLYSDSLTMCREAKFSHYDIKNTSLYGSGLKNLYTEHISGDEFFLDSFVPLPIDLAKKSEIKFIYLDSQFTYEGSSAHGIPTVTENSVPFFFGERFRGTLGSASGDLVLDSWTSSPFPFKKEFATVERRFQQTYFLPEPVEFDYNFSSGEPSVSPDSSNIGIFYYNVAEEVAGSAPEKGVFAFSSDNKELSSVSYNPRIEPESNPISFTATAEGYESSNNPAAKEVIYTAYGDEIYKNNNRIYKSNNPDVKLYGIGVSRITHTRIAGLNPVVSNRVCAVGEKGGQPYMLSITGSRVPDHIFTGTGAIYDYCSYYRDYTIVSPYINYWTPSNAFAVGYRSDTSLATIWGANGSPSDIDDPYAMDPNKFAPCSFLPLDAHLALLVRRRFRAITALRSGGYYIAVGDYNVNGPNPSPVEKGIIAIGPTSAHSNTWWMLNYNDPNDLLDGMHFYCVETMRNGSSESIAILAGLDEKASVDGTHIIKIVFDTSTTPQPTITSVVKIPSENIGGKYEGSYNGITLMDDEFYLFGEDGMVQKISNSTNWEMVDVSAEFSGTDYNYGYASVTPQNEHSTLHKSRRLSTSPFVLTKDNLIFANVDVVKTEDDSPYSIFNMPREREEISEHTHYTASTLENSLRAFYGFGKGYTISLDGSIISQPEGNFTILPNKGVGYRDYKITPANPVETVRLIGPIPHGFSYGVMNVIPTPSKCIFRRNHYGHFRDMLEQRPMAKYYSTSEGSDASSQVPVVRVHILEDTREGELIKEYMAATEPVEFNWYDSGIYDVEYRAGQPFFDYRDI